MAVTPGLSAEHSSWRWITRDEIETSDLTGKTRKVVEQWWAQRSGGPGSENPPYGATC